MRSRLHREAGVPEPPLAEPSAPEPATSTVDDDLAVRVRAVQQRLDQLQSRSSGRSLGL